MSANPDPSAPAIEIVDVSKSYGDLSVLKNINLSIGQGEFVALLGPSGCGKSTLLKLIAGLEEITDGEIYVGGKLANYLHPGDRDVAMVFQNYALYPHMTVEENIAFPLKMARFPKEEIRNKVDTAAKLLHLDTQLTLYPDELSGGQRQRVALGRAIVREPVAFLMDEPLSNLDALLRVKMRSELVQLHKRVGRTTIYVTHDQIEAMTMAHRVVLLNHGVVQQVGSPAELYARPANTFAASFVGSPPMNLVSGRIETVANARVFKGPFSHPVDKLLPDGFADQPVTLGIRPEQLQQTDSNDPAGIAANAAFIERVGADLFVTAALSAGGEIIIRVEATSDLNEGDRLFVRLPLEGGCVFNASGSRIGKDLQ